MVNKEHFWCLSMFSSPLYPNAVLMYSKHGSRAIQNFKLWHSYYCKVWYISEHDGSAGRGAKICCMKETTGLAPRKWCCISGWTLLRWSFHEPKEKQVLRAHGAWGSEWMNTSKSGGSRLHQRQLPVLDFWRFFWLQHLSRVTQSRRRACAVAHGCPGMRACVSRTAAAVPLIYNNTRAQRAFVFSRKECDLLCSQTRPNPMLFPFCLCFVSRCPHNTFP